LDDGAFVLNLKTHHMLQVFALKDSVVASIIEGSYGVRFLDGHWYGFFGGFNESRPQIVAEASTRRDLFRVDLDTGATTLVSRGSDQGGNWLVGPGGEVVARYQYYWGTGKWQVLAGPEGDRVLASGHSQFGLGGDLYIGRTADEILFARPADAEGPPTLETIPLSGGPAVEVPDGGCVKCVIVDGASKRWIGTIKDADKPDVQLFDPGLESRVHAIFDAFPDRTSELKSWNDAFTWMILFTSGGSDSGTYYLVDLPHAKAQSIGFAYPTIESEDVGPARMVDYPAGDGLRIHGVLILPPGLDPKGLPMIVLPLGMGERAYPAFSAVAQGLASRGYAVFRPNARGSSGYGADFIDAGYGQLGGKIQTDISDGVAELVRQGVVDPKRVCIGGGFWGGYDALAAVTIQHGIYRCAISVDGYSDLNDAVLESKKNTAGENNLTRFLRDMVGPKWGSEAAMRAISPIDNAAQADAPILLIYNKDDPTSSRQQAVGMSDALRRAGKTVELLAQDGDVDEAATEANNVAQVQAIDAFVEKYNPPGPPRSAAVETHPQP